MISFYKINVIKIIISLSLLKTNVRLVIGLIDIIKFVVFISPLKTGERLVTWPLKKGEEERLC